MQTICLHFHYGPCSENGHVQFWGCPSVGDISINAVCGRLFDTRWHVLRTSPTHNPAHSIKEAFHAIYTCIVHLVSKLLHCPMCAENNDVCAVFLKVCV